MKSTVVLVVVFYTYLCSNEVASIPYTQDTARYQGATPTSGLSSSLNYEYEQIANLYSQNLVAQNAWNQREFEIQQNLNAQQMYGHNQVNDFRNQVPQSFLRENKFPEVNSYRGFNQGSIGNSAQLQQSQPSNVWLQNPSQTFVAPEEINNQALLQSQQVLPPLFGVYQQPSTVPQNNQNNQQFLVNVPGNGSPVLTGNVQQQNRYAVVYPEQRFEYNTDKEEIKQQYQNRLAVNNRQELPPVSRPQLTPFPVPNITTQTTPIFKTTQFVLPGPALTYPIPTPTLTNSAFAPTYIISSTPLTSGSAYSTPAYTPTSQQLKPLSHSDINDVIALTKRFSENAAREAREKAIAQLNASNSRPTPAPISNKQSTASASTVATSTASASLSSSGTSTSAASETSASVSTSKAPSTSTEAPPSTSTVSSITSTCPTLPDTPTTPVQTPAAPVIKSGRNGAVSWFSTADPNWLTTLLGDDDKGVVFFGMAPTYEVWERTID